MPKLFHHPRALSISGPAVTAGGLAHFSPLSLSGTDGINALFSYTLRLQSSDVTGFADLGLSAKPGTAFHPDQVIGKEITCHIELEGRGSFVSGLPGGAAVNVGVGVRELSALVTEARFVGLDSRHAVIECTLQPWLHLASLSSDCKVFQNQTPVDTMLAVFPQPEEDDMVRSLGEGKSMGSNQQGEQQALLAAMRKQYDRDLAGWNSLGMHEQMERPHMEPQKPALLQTADQVRKPVKNSKTGEIESMGLKVLLARLITHNKRRPLPKPASNYRQVYIHSKLKLIDDSFLTLDSANMNLRSMAGDSEINMFTNDVDKATELRKQVWAQHTGGFSFCDGGDGTEKAILRAFND